jgi:glycosyltransferase involved in cell wall biosynthesis
VVAVYRNHSVAVVVPAYNETGLIGEVIRTIPSFVDRVYVIDDCSTDGTWEEIEKHAAAVNREHGRPPAIADGGHGATASAGPGIPGPRVVPIRNEVNRGRGASVKRGFRRALEDEMDVVAMMDGDGQMDPAVLDRILDPVVEGRADYAKGNRLTAEGGWEGMTRFRLFGNLTLSFLTKMSTGYWGVGDSQNGYAAISREALERIDIDDLYEDYGFENDILAKLNLHDMRVADVPHPAVYGEETSTIQYGSFIPRVSALLLRNFARRITDKYLLGGFHPVAAFYLLAAVALVVGVVGSAYSLVTWAEGSLVGGLFSVLVFLFGGLFLVAALAFDVRLNAHLSAHGEGG